jgi:hypothetical protein
MWYTQAAKVKAAVSKTQEAELLRLRAALKDAEVRFDLPFTCCFSFAFREQANRLTRPQDKLIRLEQLLPRSTDEYSSIEDRLRDVFLPLFLCLSPISLCVCVCVQFCILMPPVSNFQANP